MARPAARRDEDNINLDIIARLGINMGNCIRCRRHTPQPVCVNCGIKVSRQPPRFDLYESRRSPTPRDQVNLAAAQLDPARNDSPAVQAEPPCRAALAPSPKSFSFLTVHPRGSAIARS
jgi:hypothetical protein